MRVVGNIPHPKISITLFQMNDKYIVKLEAGGMEQAFKFPISEVPDLETLKSIVDESFLSSAIERFNQMFMEMKAARERFASKQ
jgi:hypothetical protein